MRKTTLLILPVARGRVPAGASSSPMSFVAKGEASRENKRKRCQLAWSNGLSGSQTQRHNIAL